MLHEPELIVLDEPFSGLDPVNTRLVKDILAELTAAGCTIIMSTHQMYQVEALCNRIALIDHGSTVLYGPVDEIKRSFAGNAVPSTAQGDFHGLPGVLEARRENGDWRLSLAPGADPQAVFRALAELPDVRIDRFEIAEPSLDDIFISVVTAEGRQTMHKLWLIARREYLKCCEDEGLPPAHAGSAGWPSWSSWPSSRRVESGDR